VGCSGLYYAAVLGCIRCRVLQCVAVCRNGLQWVAACCSVLSVTVDVLPLSSDGVAVCCSVYPRVAVLQCYQRQLTRFTQSRRCVLQCIAVCCSTLQYVAEYCSVVQCVAECCSELQ